MDRRNDVFRDLESLEGRTRMEAGTLDTRNGPLGITVAEIGSTRTISLEGELDLANVATVIEAIDECVDAGAEIVVLDLDRLEFIDSSGLSALLIADEKLGREGSDALRIVPSRAVAVNRVLEVCGLDDALPFLPQQTAPR